MICKVNDAIINFCIKVIEEPFIFFSESDLHFLLARKLLEIIPKLKDLEKMKIGNIYRKNPYRTRMLHLEYGGNNKSRMDLAIFSEKDVNEINHYHLTKDNYSGYLKPRFAFELGVGRDVNNHITNDINKLKRCKEEGAGYIIHILRDDTVRRSGTIPRSKTEKSIEDKFKRPIEAKSKLVPSKIKIVAIRLNPRREKEKEWIRCEIFNKNKTKAVYWEKYKNMDSKDFENIKTTLKSQLN